MYVTMLIAAYPHLFINLRCCNINNKVAYTKDGWHDTKDIQSGNMTVNRNIEGIKNILVMLNRFC